MISRLWSTGVNVTPLIKRCAACRVTTDPLMGVTKQSESLLFGPSGNPLFNGAM